MDLPYIPLKGGKYDGQKIYDPKIKIGEEDIVHVVDADRDVREVYQVDLNGEGVVVKNPRKAIRTGGLHRVFSTDLHS